VEEVPVLKDLNVNGRVVLYPVELRHNNNTFRKLFLS